MNTYKIDFNSVQWESPLKGVRFKKFISNGKQIRLVEYTKEFIEPDWCNKGHIGYIINGELEIDFNGTFVHYNQGDSIFIPEGESHKHKARIISDSALVFLTENL